ncbi:hypothetical protein ACP70R_045194 [Stipagrostis hirtigluma subsp. patula]
MKSSLRSQQETRRVCDGVIIGAMLLSLYVLNIVQGQILYCATQFAGGKAEDQLQELMNCSTLMEAKGRCGQEEARLRLLVDAATRATATGRCGHGVARRRRRGGGHTRRRLEEMRPRRGTATSTGRRGGVDAEARQGPP